MMVAILQLKASTLNVYIVSFTVVIFTILNDIINKFVPLVKIRTEFKSPWFDSECYQKCKEKE